MHPIFERRPKPARRNAARSAIVDQAPTPSERVFAAVTVAMMIATAILVASLG